MIEAFKKAGFWSNDNVKVTTYRANLVKKEDFSLIIDRIIDLGGYDAIFSDVLGYYLSEEELEILPLVFYSLLSPGGLIFMRDLDEVANVEERILRRSDEEEKEVEKAINLFYSWLKEIFGWNISVEKIKEMRDNLFRGVGYAGREEHLSSWLKDLFTIKIDLQLLYEGLTVPNYLRVDPPPRIFPIFVFQKALFQKERQFASYSYIQNSRGTSIALKMVDIV